MLGTLGDQVSQNLPGLRLVAQEISLGNAGNVLTQALGKLYEFLAIRFICGFKFLETLVAGNDEQIVHPGQKLGQLLRCLQPILSIVFQFLTFLTE